MFVEIPASDLSLSQRKSIFGIAKNDATYMVRAKINGKLKTCPIYSKWKSMLDRCYCPKHHVKFPKYKGVTVCDEWLLFSNFKSWMEKQDWEGKELDKDILIQGNKVYSPDRCIFVTNKINSLILGKRSDRGVFPTGVYFDKERGKYAAECSKNNKKVHLGRFDTVDEAFNVYREFKLKTIKEVAEKQDEPLRSALLNYKIKPD